MGVPNEPFKSKALAFVKFSSGITLLLDSYSMTNTISTPTSSLSVSVDAVLVPRWHLLITFSNISNFMRFIAAINICCNKAYY